MNLLVIALAAAVAAAQEPSLERAMRDAASGSSFDVYQHVRRERAAELEWIADNSAHRLQASFRANGVSLTVNGEAGNEEKLDLALVSCGRPAAQRRVAPAQFTTAGSAIELDRGSLVE